MLQFCKPGAKTISIPRIHNNALWPIYAKRHTRDIYYGGDYLEHYNGTRDELISMYDNGSLDFRIRERFDRNIQMSTERERTTDVKVVPFILENIKHCQLFLTQDHPTTCVFKHVVDQLLEPLGISFISTVPDNDNLTILEDSVYHLSTHRYPQSSYAKYGLGLTWVTQTNDMFWRQCLIDHIKLKNV
jgi:hypothetical protein